VAYVIRLQNLPSIPVAVVKRTATATELSRIVPEYCGIVWNELRRQGTKGGRHVAIYWNGDIQLEVGAELEGPFAEHDRVVRSATPSGMVATTAHLGPYQRLGDAHDAVRTWCEANGHRLAGPNWEIYGHWRTEWDSNPALIRTDVYYQIEST
jgi:effector-binding domain-containing protein